MTPLINAGRFTFSPDRPLVVGIVNVTPDSFSDGGLFATTDAAIRHALQLHDEGADIVDVGGESTRPGAAPVAEADELARVIPVIEALASQDIAVSIDTQKPRVMRAAIEAGVAMVNDVNALRAQGAIEACATSNVAVCLMHMQGEPRVMQANPQYHDVVQEVDEFLRARAAACEAGGIEKHHIVIDPGIGFGKTLDHNLALLRATQKFSQSGYPVLIGVSRKSMFKALLNREVEDRLVPSVVAAVLAAQNGAAVVRVHDVRETRDALRLWGAIR
jgi:dihydropteroate synthase